MSKKKRLRFFAGPNGSGKSTLFHKIHTNFGTGYFVNSDEVEAKISKTGYINLEEFGLELTQEDLDTFLQTTDAASLFKKAIDEGHVVDIHLKENVIVDGSKETHSYEAALITSFIRFHMTQKGISYAFESVMSHPSKLDEIVNAKKQGYTIYFYFVCTDDASVNISRVQNRVEKGGHGVSEIKIKQRYNKVLELLLQAIEVSDKCYLFDNSTEEMNLIAKVKEGEFTILRDASELPNWFINYVVNKL